MDDFRWFLGQALLLLAVLCAGGVYVFFWYVSDFSLVQSLAILAVSALTFAGLWRLESFEPKMLGVLIYGAVQLLFLHYVSGLGTSQSFALTLACICVYSSFARDEWAFSPYWISVRPNWYQLLHDQGLVSDEGEWEKMRADAEHRTNELKDLFPSDTMFTVLYSGSPSRPFIYYSSGHFSSEVRFAMRCPWCNGSPTIYMKRSGSGYELGLSGQYEPPVPDTVLAVLPYEELHVYNLWQGHPPGLSLWSWERVWKRRHKLENLLEAKLKKNRAENGWAVNLNPA